MKKPELYDSNGYVNIKGILETGCPFIFIWGGRGTGENVWYFETRCRKQ